MKNEILEELWKSKDEIAKECGHGIDRLVQRLREKERSTRARIVDFTTGRKNTAPAKRRKVNVGVK